MQHVLTLISAKKGGLTPEIIQNYTSVILGEHDWLCPDQALDIYFDTEPPETWPEVQGVDLFCQPVMGRRKKMLISDMDATILQGETQDELAAFLGVEDQIKDITHRSMHGEIQYEEAATETVALLKGLEVQTMRNLAPELPMNAGAETLVQTMKSSGAMCILVSGGYTIVTEIIADKLGFDDHFGNTLIENAGLLTGEIQLPILGRESKAEILREQARKYGISLSEVTTIGDGANDIAMLQAAGLGVSFHGKPKVVEATEHHIKYGDLTALLYAQGFKEEEFVTTT